MWNVVQRTPYDNMVVPMEVISLDACGIRPYDGRVDNEARKQYCHGLRRIGIYGEVVKDNGRRHLHNPPGIKTWNPPFCVYDPKLRIRRGLDDHSGIGGNRGARIPRSEPDVVLALVCV